MKTLTISKSKLKPRLFEILRQVEAGQHDVWVTDRNQPVVKLVAARAAEDEELAYMRGMVKEFEGYDIPLDEPWEAAQ